MRIWSYHQVYDDLFILIPGIALWRIAKSSREPRVVIFAVLLLGINALSLFGTTLPPNSSDTLEYAAQGIHGLIWLATLAFLVWDTHIQDAQWNDEFVLPETAD